MKKVIEKFDYTINTKWIKKRLNLKKLIKYFQKNEKKSFASYDALEINYHKLGIYILACLSCMDKFSGYDIDEMCYQTGLNKEGEDDGNFIEEISEKCENGMFLPSISENFKLKKYLYKYKEKNIKEHYFGEITSYHVISSKINKTHYIAIFHGSDHPTKAHESYQIKKKINKLKEAIDYVKKLKEIK